jgi:hypothetical protein
MIWGSPIFGNLKIYTGFTYENAVHSYVDQENHNWFELCFVNNILIILWKHKTLVYGAKGREWGNDPIQNYFHNHPISSLPTKHREEYLDQ